MARVSVAEVGGLSWPGLSNKRVIADFESSRIRQSTDNAVQRGEMLREASV